MKLSITRKEAIKYQLTYLISYLHRSSQCIPRMVLLQDRQLFVDVISQARMKCQIPYHFVYVKLWDRVAYDLKLSVVFDLSHGSLHCERAILYGHTCIG